MERKTTLKKCMAFLLSALMVLSMSTTVFATEGNAVQNDNSTTAASQSNTGAEAAADVQKLIDALPAADEITADNADAVKAQLEAIDTAKAELSDEEMDKLDTAKYAAAAGKLEALENSDESNSSQTNAPATIAEGDVAQIGDKGYATFADAYENVKDGEEIKVLKSTNWISDNSNLKLSALAITKSFTIDLNGQKLTLERNGETTGFYLDLTTSGKTLTIKDSQGNGKLTTPYDGYLIRLNKGNLTLISGTLETANATRTVYLYKENSVFTMTGGTLINSAAYKSDHSNVLEVSNGTAIISGGEIKATNEAAPVYGIKVGSSSAAVTIDGVNINTGTARAIWVNGKGALTLEKATFDGTTGPSAYLNYNGSTVKIGGGAEELTIPKLSIGSSASGITINDNVTVEELDVIPSSGSTDYTFKIDNIFGGKYGTDFTDNIVGIGRTCEKIENSKYYKVVPLDENSDKVVAVITKEDGTTQVFGKADAAFTALQNGDKLTLKKDVVNSSTTSLKTTASNITIDLNGHNITAENASYGIWIYPTSSGISDGDTVNIIDNGSIIGKKYAVYGSTNGSSNTKPTCTLSIGSDVKIDVDDAEGVVPVGLMAQQVRLHMEKEPTDYTAITNGRAKTTIDGKTYVYAYPVKAINDQPSSGGTVQLLGDCEIGSSSSANVAVNTGVVELDLNNHILSSTGQQGLISNGAGLTIKNGTIEHNYAKASEKSYGYAIGSTGGQGNSSLTLENVTINENSNYAIALTANGTLKNVGITLKECTINCTGTGSTSGVYFPVENGTLDIEDTEITAMNAVQIKGGTVTVKGDETKITSTGAKAEPGTESSGCTDTGDGIYVEDTYGFNPIVKVEGGTVISANSNALNYYDNNDQAGSDGKIEVSGGAFSSDVTQYCIENKKTVRTINSGSNYVIVPANVFVEMKIGENDAVQYSDQQAFMSALTQSTGDIKIKLLGNVEIAGFVPVAETQNVIFDLNGNILSTTTKSNDPSRHYYAIDNYGTLTIKDTSEDGAGIIRARGVENFKNGKLTVESGTIISIDTNGGACIWNEADLIVTGGTFKTEYIGTASDNVGIGCLNNSGKALISGGTFEDVNKRTYAIISTGEIEITPAQDKAVTIHGAHGGLAIDSGFAVVNGGSYSSDDYYGLYVSNDGNGVDPTKAAVTINGGTFDGKQYSVWVGSDINNPVNSTIEITDGIFQKPLNAQENTREGAIAISGGLFSEVVPDDYCASGFVPTTTPDADGKYTVTVAVAKIDSKEYGSLEEAINEAKSDDTITVIKDTTIEAEQKIKIAEGVTLKINDDVILTNKGTIDVYGTLDGDKNVENENNGKLNYHIKGITIDKNTVDLKVGETQQLTVTKNPANAVEEITWTSSDEKVVTVDENGKVTAVAASSDSVTITATAADGVKAICTINVSKKDAPAAPSGIKGENESVKGRNDGKITGMTDKMEYRVKTDAVAGKWEPCSEGDLTGLAPGTYEVRIAETADTLAGIAAEVTIATGAEPTYTLNVTAPTFDSVDYGYDQPKAESITISSTGNSDATIKSVAVDKVGDKDVFEITEGDKNVTAGGSVTSWKLQPKAGLDAGTYEATITVTYNDGATATARVVFKVNVTSQSAPAAPTVKESTYTSITLEPLADSPTGAKAQYSKDGGQTWQDSNVFENLLPGTEYSFVASYKATDDGNYAESLASEVLKVSTKAGVTKDTVTSDDKDELLKEKEALETALNDDKYSDAEKEQIKGRLAEVEAALTALENADKVSDLIENLPNADDVQKSDADAIQAAKDAYDNLTDHEKELVGEAAKAKLDAAIEALAALNDEEIVTPGSGTGDDPTIDRTNIGQTAESKTGDEMNLMIWAVIALTAMLLATITLIFRRKRINK